MKFYIATGLENIKSHNRVRDWLIRDGHEITYDWTLHGAAYPQGMVYVKRIMAKEVQGVKDADFVVVLHPGGRGTHVELGIAIACQAPVLMFSKTKETVECSPELCGFYVLPNVMHFVWHDLVVDARDKRDFHTVLDSLEELRKYMVRNEYFRANRPPDGHWANLTLSTGEVMYLGEKMPGPSPIDVHRALVTRVDVIAKPTEAALVTFNQVVSPSIDQDAVFSYVKGVAIDAMKLLAKPVEKPKADEKPKEKK
jgi:hypothetical protein